eukprot:TRINITY_DN64371_c0_g1_i1.p1 TRINITY_DN64371_c0_g1~~TRINITY_DN64371_c0_g1_i1.p1  ORF type:complete len:371 (+),score=50.57 TRINITY_DN64371_c0_g1_i1:67-1113(+)
MDLPIDLAADLDRVLPLNFSAPPTARSSTSSVATPRTGGGTTARSSDGRGTPREHERLPLGTRPPRAVMEVPRLSSGPLQLSATAAYSPLTSARSGVISSPTSTQGALSSRREGDAFCYGRQDSNNACPQRTMASYYAEAGLSREIEAMRHVIVKENNRLRERIAEGQAAVRALAATLPPPPSETFQEGPVDAVSPMRRRVVEWTVRGVNGVAGASEGLRGWHRFEIPEMPSVSFTLAFGGNRSWSGSSASSSSCRLELRPSSSKCAMFSARVSLSAHVLEAAAGASARPSGVTSAAGVREGTLAAPLGEARSLPLATGGRAFCQCSWPPGTCTDVLCRVDIELLSFG